VFCFPSHCGFKGIELQDHPLIIDNKQIMPTRSHKCLGVHLDESLTFNSHSLAVVKGLQQLGSLKFLGVKTQGLPAFVAHHPGFSTIPPAMLWASPIWWNGTPAVPDSLQITYNSIARWITGLPINTEL
jgi:hypothetical protein